MKCGYIQGYFFAKPMPSKDAERVLKLLGGQPRTAVRSLSEVR